MRLGFHLPVAGGLERAVRAASDLGLECLQIFAGNPRSWAQRPLDAEKSAQARELVARAGLYPLTVHAPYLINLASPSDGLWRRSVEALAEQTRRATALGAQAVVVHPGSRGGASLEWGLERVAEGVRLALELAGPGSGCLLENTAGGGGQIGGTLSQLSWLMERLAGWPVGVCLDTAHAYAAGYRLESAGEVGRFLDHVERLIGLDKVGAWHFNDTLHRRGSHRDQHTHLGRGRLGRDAFAALLADRRLAGAAAIMETPKDSRWADRRNLAFLRRLQREICNG